MLGLRIPAAVLIVVLLGLASPSVEAEDAVGRKLLARGRRGGHKPEQTAFPPWYLYVPPGESEEQIEEEIKEEIAERQAGGVLTKEQAIAEVEDDGPIFVLFIGAVFIAGGIIGGYYLYKRRDDSAVSGSVQSRRARAPRGNVSDLKNKLEKLREVTSALEG